MRDHVPKQGVLPGAPAAHSGGGGFTLVEFILVVGLLATVMALAAPSLVHFSRHRAVQREAARFVSLTEFARRQAVGRGVPMVVWIAPEDMRYGVEPRAGYPPAAGDQHAFTTHPKVELNVEQFRREADGTMEAAVFLPDGSLDSDYLEVLYLEDAFGNRRVIQTTNQWDYVVLREVSDASTRARR